MHTILCQFCFNVKDQEKENIPFLYINSLTSETQAMSRSGQIYLMMWSVLENSEFTGNFLKKILNEVLLQIDQFIKNDPVSSPVIWQSHHSWKIKVKE